MIFIYGCIRHSDSGLNRRIKDAAIEKGNVERISANLMVNDVNSTIKFYKNIAGFQVDATLPDTGSYDFAILKNGAAELRIQKRDSFAEDYDGSDTMRTGGSFTLYIEVKNILLVYERAILETEILRELHQTRFGTKEFSVKDNNGYILVFAEHLKQ